MQLAAAKSDVSFSHPLRESCGRRVLGDDPWVVEAARRRGRYGIKAYTGREWDPEIGLYYYRARYYDPEIGRFISEDPIGFAGGQNSYAYVENDPISRVDPSGLVGFGVVVGGSGTAGAVLLGFAAELSIGTGYFSGDGWKRGSFVSGAFFLGGLDSEGGNFGLCPTGENPYGNMTASFYGGLGIGVFVTNAERAEQLGGPFDALLITSPIASLEIGVSGGTFIVIVSIGPGSAGGVSSIHTEGIGWTHPELPTPFTTRQPGW